MPKAKVTKKPKKTVKKKPAKKTEKKASAKLVAKQEKFCKLYASDAEFFGNGVESYAAAYGKVVTNKKDYMVCAAAASRLLKSVKVLDRINELLDSSGLNDQHVDKQLAFLITQSADFKTKLGGIKEYNKLRGRIIDKLVVDEKPNLVADMFPCGKKKE